MSSEGKSLWAILKDFQSRKKPTKRVESTEPPSVSAKPLTWQLKEIRSLQRQRSVLIAGTVMLVTTVFCMSTLMANRQEKVILVPGIISQYELGGRDVPVKYLEDMALQVAGIFFNRHPDDTDYYEQNALRLSDVSFHDDLKTLLANERRNRFSTQASQIFRVHRMNTIPDDLTVELHGIRETIIGDSVTKREGKIYKIVFIRHGWELKLKDVFELNEKQSVDRNSNRNQILQENEQ
ncbi:MAG: hypothetical protein COA43_00645 [Robiginitomaculum sp.]|nr:MAG: hypothetical protein COA43_00645 [Robiginitomaculum sp.]